jgi:hypothetical protein
VLDKHGLMWDDALPVFETVNSLEKLHAALEEPESFLASLVEAGGPTAIKFAIGKLRPKLEPLVARRQRTWADVLPALNTVDSLEELEAALEDPEKFLHTLLDSVTAHVAVLPGEVTNRLHL